MAKKIQSAFPDTILFFSGDLLRKELERRRWPLERLSMEICMKTGNAPSFSAMKDALKATAYWDEHKGKLRMKHQPNATVAYAILLALGLTPDALMAKL